VIPAMTATRIVTMSAIVCSQVTMGFYHTLPSLHRDDFLIFLDAQGNHRDLSKNVASEKLAWNMLSMLQRG
jgi:hypothetical protein